MAFMQIPLVIFNIKNDFYQNIPKRDYLCFNMHLRKQIPIDPLHVLFVWYSVVVVHFT